MDRANIRKMLDEGKTRVDVIAYFMKEYGGQVALASPLDKGFNRLAWALPYGIGVAGAGALAYGAWRFTKKKTPAPPSAPAPAGSEDPAMEDRLEDELSKLDT